jgi:Flp pilus assembly pilin Flp
LARRLNRQFPSNENLGTLELHQMTKLIAAFIRDTAGQELIEYALLGTLIALSCITAVAGVGTPVNAAFVHIDTSFTAAS